MGENALVIRDPKTFCFYFDQPKDVDDHLKHKMEFSNECNEFLFENKIRNKIE